MTPQERKKEIKIVEDFFEIIENNPPKGTYAYIYYFAEYKPSGLRKFIRDDNGRRITNELYNNLYKNTVVKFNYESTYRDKIKKINPDWDIQKSNRNTTKIDGYDLIEIDEKGEIEIPVADPIIVYQQYYKKLDDGRFIDISEDYMRYFMSSNIIQHEPESGVKFGRYKLDKIYKMSVYGNVWKNPLFIYKNNDILSLKENLSYNGTQQLNESLNSSKLEKACDSMLTRQNKKNPLIETKQDFFKFLFFNKNDKYKTDIIEDKDVIYPIKNLDRYKDLLDTHGNKSGCALWRKISTGKLEIKPSNRDLDDNWKFEEGVVIKNNNNTVKKSEKYINKEKINKIKPTAFSKLHKKISSKKDK